ncbi:MAG: hypothetical protein A2061_07615 [Gallionellales bacterium GWA2_59_43]|nr:MAG: hypothetical protein A2061_07615 [Gallionellales bacterium GWA2_59_43]
MDIKDFMPLVRLIALNIHRPLPPNILLEDLVQDGMIGLIMAFREHDAGSGIPFKSFTHNKIRWAIMDGLRASDWAERAVRGRANKVARTIDSLQAQLHREPTKKEIADALGIRVDDVTTILSDAHGIDFIQIDDHLQDDMQDIPDSSMEPSAIVDRRMSHSRAVAGLKTLQPNERKVFILRTMCDMSGQQTAAEMALSESRVSQLYKAANQKLANYVSRPRYATH